AHAPPPRRIYTLSLHDALPIYRGYMALAIGTRIERRTKLFCHLDLLAQFGEGGFRQEARQFRISDHRGHCIERGVHDRVTEPVRSEEHTSELQSRSDLVCRLLL